MLPESCPIGVAGPMPIETMCFGDQFPSKFLQYSLTLECIQSLSCSQIGAGSIQYLNSYTVRMLAGEVFHNR